MLQQPLALVFQIFVAMIRFNFVELIRYFNLGSPLILKLIEKTLVKRRHFNDFTMKGYLRNKTIFCHKVSLNLQLMNVFI